MHSRRSYSKKKVPYQTTLEERYTTSRAKIEHLNLGKRYIKYTYSESTLDELFKTLFFQYSSKLQVSTDGVNGWCQPLQGLKRGQVYWPISLKRLNKNKTPLVLFVALPEIRIILKNELNRYILRGVIAKRRYRTK